jgi:hypothetical protein
MKPVFSIFVVLCLLLNVGSVFAQDEKTMQKKLTEFWHARMFAPLLLKNGQIDAPPPIPASTEALEESLTGTSGGVCFNFANPFYEILSFHRVVDGNDIFSRENPYDALLEGVHGHPKYASVLGNKAPQWALKNTDAKLEKCSLPARTGVRHTKTEPV